MNHNLQNRLLMLWLILCVCWPPARAQRSQNEQATGPIRLAGGRTFPMKLTVENKCPKAESFLVTSEHFPAGLVSATGPLAIAASSSFDTELVVNTKNLESGLYTGEIVVTCSTCGTECIQDRRVFPEQFLIEEQKTTTSSEPPNTQEQMSDMPKGNPPSGTSPAPPPNEIPQTTSKGPCPCEDLCRAAVSADVTAQGLLEEYKRISGLSETTRSLIQSLQNSSYRDRDLAAHYEAMGGYESEAQRLRKEATELQGQIGAYQTQLMQLEKRRDNAAEKYNAAATKAAAARAKCDECMAEHPECPRSPWTAGGFTTEKPPDPDAPYLHAPDDFPPVNVGTNPTGDHDLHRNDKGDDCPERHRGCIALVIDMMKNDPATHFFQEQQAKLERYIATARDPKLRKIYEDSLRYLPKRPDLRAKLKSAGCRVPYDEEPDFWPLPPTIVVGFDAGPPISLDPGGVIRDAVMKHNATEQAKLALAIEQHRAQVAEAKPEIALEIIDAHGGGAWDVEFDRRWRCGDVGPGYSTGTGGLLFRADFHEGNYKAAKNNVCSWFTLDLSCYGGLTPKVVDELDNLATSTCRAASVINCGNHAGWEADGSMASATAITACSFGTAYRQENLFADALDRQAARTRGMTNPDFTAFITDLKRIQRGGTSFYSDRGYAKDRPPIHVHAGYPTIAAPATCSGGKCAQ